MCHSLHAYFIRPGDPSIPVIYEVDRARDGGSFTTRRVVAIQHGKQILNLSASYHVDEPGWDYQHEMPKVDGPENLQTRSEARAELAAQVREEFREEFTRPRPYDMREIEPRDLLNPEPAGDLNYAWMRADEAANADPVTQQLLLTYMSDLQLLSTSLRPHGLTWLRRNVMTASLDHAMWFHAPVRLQDWHLYVMDAPFCREGTGAEPRIDLSRGRHARRDRDAGGAGPAGEEKELREG